MESPKGKVSEGIWRMEGEQEDCRGEVAGARGQAMQGLESQAAELRPSPEGTGEPQQVTDKKSDFASKRPFWLLVGDGLEGEAGRQLSFHSSDPTLSTGATRQLPPRGLSTRCSLCWECSSLHVSTAPSLPYFKHSLACPLLREAVLDHPLSKTASYPHPT